MSEGGGASSGEEECGERASDAELVARVNAGEADAAGAFGELYERHKGWAMAAARRFTPSEGAAADVVQDAFVSLLRQFPGFELTSALRTYLYSVIRNRAREVRRRESRLRLVGDGGEVGPVLSARGWAGDADGADVERDERLRSLREAVGRLEESRREVLILRVVDGFSVAEAARALGIPEGTVKSRLHLAIRDLREDPGARGYFE